MELLEFVLYIAYMAFCLWLGVCGLPIKTKLIIFTFVVVTACLVVVMFENGTLILD